MASKVQSSKQAEAFIYLGYIEARKGEWLNGVSYFTQAHNLINEQSEPVLMGANRQRNGLLCLMKADCRKTDGSNISARWNITDKRKVAAPYNRMLMRIGYSYFLLKDYSAALTHLQQALRDF